MTLVDDVKFLLEASPMNAGDIRTMLRNDHDEALILARDMCESESVDERRTLLKKLKPALVAHSRAEEREVYEPLRLLRDGQEAQDLAHEGFVEHWLLDELLERLARSRKTESVEWKAHAKVLKELLEHHVREEQKEMFELLAEHFDDDERAAMGRRFAAAKARAIMQLKARAAA